MLAGFVTFVAGLIAGVVVGVSVAAYAATIAGEGRLAEWTVTRNGEEICSNPSVWPATQQIDCK